MNEENLKLKQKVSQKIEPNKHFNENIQVLSQNRYIDALQDLLKSLKNDLNKRKQENFELRKQIYKAKDSKTKESWSSRQN